MDLRRRTGIPGAPHCRPRWPASPTASSRFWPAAAPCTARASRRATSISFSSPRFHPISSCPTRPASAKRSAPPGRSALDVSAACSGFVYALSIADSVRPHGSVQRAILVVGAEVLSPLVNWDDRGTCILFGDGAWRHRSSWAVRPKAKQVADLLDEPLCRRQPQGDYFHVPAGGNP